MAIPAIAGSGCGDGLGAAQLVAWASSRRRKVGGRPRQSAWRLPVVKAPGIKALGTKALGVRAPGMKALGGEGDGRVR